MPDGGALFRIPAVVAAPPRRIWEMVPESCRWPALETPVRLTKRDLLHRASETLRANQKVSLACPTRSARQLAAVSQLIGLDPSPAALASHDTELAPFRWKKILPQYSPVHEPSGMLFDWRSGPADVVSSLELRFGAVCPSRDASSQPRGHKKAISSSEPHLALGWPAPRPTSQSNPGFDHGFTWGLCQDRQRQYRGKGGSAA